MFEIVIVHPYFTFLSIFFSNMPLIFASQQENLNFNLIELRKLRIADSIDSGFYNNVAISNKYQVAFVAFKNVVRAIKIETILDFKWSKNIINQALDTYSCFNIELSFYPTFLSISGGNNNILIASGSNSSNNLKIEFFQVSLILQNILKPFNRLDFNLNECTNICSVDWHPEFSESLFAATLTNGSFISVGIDLQSKGIQLLSHFLDSSKFTCVSWSPKGKQLVVGGTNGSLTQYKHTNGKNFQKAKSIPPPKELTNFKIIDVRWVHTSLFQTVFINPTSPSDPDTRVIFIYAIPKTQPEYFDFGHVCIDGIPYPGQDKFHFQLNQLGNVLLCSSSCSSEIGVIGCMNKEVTPTPVTWNLWVLDDTSRIELQPSKNGIDSYPCGLAWFKGPTKTFRVSESVTYGGENVPLILILSSSGLLCPYYASDSNHNLFIPNVPNPQPLPITLPPPNLKPQTKIEAKSTSQTQPPLQAQQIQLGQQTQQAKAANVLNASSTPSSGMFNNAPLQSVFTSSQVTKSVTSSAASAVSASTSKNFVNQAQPMTNKSQEIISHSNAQPVKPLQQNQIEKSTETKIIPPVTTISESELKKREEKAKEEAFSIAICEEVNDFSCQLKAAKEKYYKILSLKVGNDNEMTKLKSETLAITEMFKLINDTLKSIDIFTLNGFVLETFAMEQEAESRIQRDTDPVFTELLNKRALDPISARKMIVIKKLAHYIENQLQECNFVLDQEWNEYIASINKAKDKKESSSLFMIIQTLSNNHKTIELLKNKLKELDPDFKQVKESPSKPTFKSINKLDIEQLINSLEETKIKDDPSYDEDLKHLKPGVKIKTLDKEKKEKILEVLEQRNFVPIIRSNLPVNLESSKMVSAIVKAKEKLKTIKSKTQTFSKLENQTSYQTQKSSPALSASAKTSTSTLSSSITFSSKPAEKLFQSKSDSAANVQSFLQNNSVTKNSTSTFTSLTNKPVDTYSQHFKKETTTTTVSSNLSVDKKAISTNQSSKTSTPIKTELNFSKVSPKPSSSQYKDITPPLSPSIIINNSLAASFSVSTPASKIEQTPLKLLPAQSFVPDKTNFFSNPSPELENSFNCSINEKTEKTETETETETTETTETTVTTLPVKVSVEVKKEEDKLKLPLDTGNKFNVFVTSEKSKVNSENKNLPFQFEQLSSTKNNLPAQTTSSLVANVPLTSSACCSSPTFSMSIPSTLSKSNQAEDLSQPKSQEIIKAELPTSVTMSASTSESYTSTTSTFSVKDIKLQPSIIKSTTSESFSFSTPTTSQSSQPLLASSSAPTTLSTSTTTTTTSPFFEKSTSFLSNSSTPSSANTTTATTASTESAFTSNTFPTSTFSFSSTQSFSQNTNAVFGNSTSSTLTSSASTTASNAFQSKPNPSFSQTEPVSFNFNSLQSLGSKPSQGNVNQNPFGSAITNTSPHQQQQNTSLFSNTTSPTSFVSGGTGVGQTGFNTNFGSPLTPKFGEFGGPPSFSSSPLLGNQTFGSPPIFGGSPSFPSPTYKQTGFGSSATNSASNDSFANFANSDAPSFGSLATQQGSSFEFLANSGANTQQAQQSPSFGFGAQNMVPAPVFSNTFQTNTSPFTLPQFSQRR